MSDPILDEIGFFGKITASTTHELQNVLAIIQESAGLMEDILIFSGADSELLREKLQKPLSVIEKQLQRGIDLTTRLNRFAHSPDQPLVRLDLYEITEQMAVLSSRFAASKHVTLTNHAPDLSIQIVVNLVQLQMALFSSIEYCLTLMTPNGQLEISLEKLPKKVLIKLCCDGYFIGNGEENQIFPFTSHEDSFAKNVTSQKSSIEFHRSENGIILSLPQ